METVPLADVMKIPNSGGLFVCNPGVVPPQDVHKYSVKDPKRMKQKIFIDPPLGDSLSDQKSLTVDPSSSSSPVADWQAPIEL